MALDVKPAVASDKPRLRNLLTEYLSELSTYGDVNLAYPFFDAYWQNESCRWPYLVQKNVELVGFALVNNWSPSGIGTDFAMAEFYIIPEARSHGIGLHAATAVLLEHPGVWELSVMALNASAQRFWPKVLEAADVRQFERIERAGETIYRFRTGEQPMSKPKQTEQNTLGANVDNLLSQAERNSAAGQGGTPIGGFNALVPELDVTNLDESLTFWCGMLGFKVAYDRTAAKFAYLERAGAQIMLCQINGEWLTGKLEHPFGRGINFQIEVEDLDPILTALTEARWPLFRAPKESWYRIGAGEESGARELLVQDPDGYLVRLSQNIGKRVIG
jgi:predicted acetyltransferase/catechol 2,3-dioxygenase-like lactoylglutathione lyase family enzyme